MAQQLDEICFMPVNLRQHDSREVAALIYESAPELFTLMYGPWAIGCLARLVERSHNRFSHQYIRIAAKAERVIGIATLVPVEHLEDDRDHLAILNTGQRLWLRLIHRLILRHVLQHNYPLGSVYVGNLAVAAAYRNQGIGRQLLSQCLEAATSKPIFISVDINNPRAQKLYESLGFQVIGSKTLNLLNISVGSRLLAISSEASQQPCC